MDGMSRNCAQLRRTFFRFGYEVLVYQNIEAKQIKDFMKTDNLADASEEKSLSKYASLVVCILSHGGKTYEGKEYVLGVDGVPVKIEPLIKKFNNYNCKELAGKPKIFIILSCWGEKSQMVLPKDPVLPVSLQASASKEDDVAAHGNNDTKSDVEDFLVLISTIPEFSNY